MNATWTVTLDTDRDNTFDAAIDDISAYVLGAQWNNGLDTWDMLNPVNFAPTLTLTVNNSSGAFSQDDAGAAYYGKLNMSTKCRIQAYDVAEDETHTLCELKLQGIQMQPGAYTSRLMTLVFGVPQLLMVGDYTQQLRTQTTADVVMQDAFDTGLISEPYDSSYMIIDAGLIDTGTIYDPAQVLDVSDGGDHTFSFVGDTEGSAISPDTLFRELMTVEQGRLWFDVRTHKFTLHSRRHDIGVIASSGTFTQVHIMPDSVYIVGGDVVNSVTVQYQPREIGAANSVIWTYRSVPMKVMAQEKRTLSAGYHDPNDESAQVAASTVLLPAVAGTDYVVNTSEDGSGTDMTNHISVYANCGGRNAEITITNHAETDLYITALQLRGTPLRTFEAATVTYSDADSVSNYDRRPAVVDAQLLDTAEQAEAHAKHFYNMLASQMTRFERITIDANASAALCTHALTRTVGDWITVSDSHTGHSADYVIIGETHSYIPGVNGDYTHLCTWMLKPTNALVGCLIEVVGRSEIGTNAIIVY